MEAGVADHVWSLEEVIALLEYFYDVTAVHGSHYSHFAGALREMDPC
jgi:hypothetical protein